jgi:hypothetical protein
MISDIKKDFSVKLIADLDQNLGKSDVKSLTDILYYASVKNIFSDLVKQQ